MSTLIEATATLSDLLEQENAALSAHDFVAATMRAEAKREAIKRLAAVQADIAPAHKPAVSPLILARLRSRLDAALAENKRLLEVAIGIQAQVIAIVLRSIEPPASSGYHGNGTQTTPVLPVALALRA